MFGRAMCAIATLAFALTTALMGSPAHAEPYRDYYEQVAYKMAGLESDGLKVRMWSDPDFSGSLSKNVRQEIDYRLRDMYEEYGYDTYIALVDPDAAYKAAGSDEPIDRLADALQDRLGYEQAVVIAIVIDGSITVVVSGEFSQDFVEHLDTSVQSVNDDKRTQGEPEKVIHNWIKRLPKLYYMEAIGSYPTDKTEAPSPEPSEEATESPASTTETTMPAPMGAKHTPLWLWIICGTAVVTVVATGFCVGRRL